MQPTLYFYDLETTGVSPRRGRVMQFAGQRTTLELEPVGEPDNFLIKLTDDILPDPEAILITGITPQATHADGLTEAEFLRRFSDKIALPGTIFAGFNTVRFDDEFMRFMLYRNFYDAYEWEWKDKRSRWDILDLVRMVRALRPDGIEWPVDAEGKPTNRLELLTTANKLLHDGAHDALSDVLATIAVARLIHNKQPKLFEYLLNMRDKASVQQLVCAGQPFVYTSGKYPGAYEKTTIVTLLGDHPDGRGAVLVYDLRADPAPFAKLTTVQVADLMQQRPTEETKRFPVKTLKFNRCPAVAPLAVVDEASAVRIKLDMKKVELHRRALADMPEVYEKICDAIKLLEKRRQAEHSQQTQEPVDARLYDGFVGEGDRNGMAVVRAAGADDIASLDIRFNDDRLNELLPLYKARNFPGRLTSEERENWDKYRENQLLGGGTDSVAARYFTALNDLAAQPDLAPGKRYLLEELRLYGESILPAPEQ